MTRWVGDPHSRTACYLPQNRPPLTTGALQHHWWRLKHPFEKPPNASITADLTNACTIWSWSYDHTHSINGKWKKLVFIEQDVIKVNTRPRPKHEHNTRHNTTRHVHDRQTTMMRLDGNTLLFPLEHLALALQGRYTFDLSSSAFASLG